MAGRRRAGSRPLTPGEVRGAAVLVAAALLMLAVVTVVVVLSQDHLGPRLAALGAPGRAAAGAAVGVVLALPGAGLGLLGRRNAAAAAVCWYLLTALLCLVGTSVSGRGYDDGSAAVFREQAGWYALTAPVCFVLVLGLLVRLVLLRPAPGRRSGRAAR